MNVGQCIVISNGELVFPAKIYSLKVRDMNLFCGAEARLTLPNNKKMILFCGISDCWYGGGYELVKNKKFHKPLKDRKNWLLVDTETGICEWWDVDSGKRIAGTLPHLRKEFLNNNSK